VISEKEFTKVLIPPLRGGRGGVLMVQTQNPPLTPNTVELRINY